MPKYIREKEKPVTPPPPDAGRIEISLPLPHPSAKHFSLSGSSQQSVCQVSFHFYDLIPAPWQWNTPLKRNCLKRWNKWKGGGAGMRLKSTLGIFPAETNPVKPRKASRSNLSRSPRKKQFIKIKIFHRSFLLKRFHAVNTLQFFSSRSSSFCLRNKIIKTKK